METLKQEIKRYGGGGAILLALMTLIAGTLLLTGVAKLATGGYESLLLWTALALILAITSSKHPLNFLGTDTAISVSEALVFLSVITLGPYHGVLFATLDMLLVSRRLGLKASLYLFNISNQTISVYVAGSAYYAASLYLTDHKLTTGTGQTLLEFALPLIAMAFAHYMLQHMMLAIRSYFIGASGFFARIRDTFPWDPASHMAGAIMAGLINYAFHEHGVITTAVTLVLMLPVPIIIYYTFKTYQDKLGEQKGHYQELTSIYDSILEMLAMAIDAKDDVTHDHIQRVKLFARRMGELVGLSEAEIEALKAGALLHDIGKIGIPAYILNKPGKLTQHEFEQMKMHTIIGADMLSNIDFRYPVVPIVRHHHERWDGRGYPDGLRGEEIPITARILTLVDNYDALRSDRPYKKGMSKEEALAYIENNAGTFFDPSLVKIFLSVIDQFEVEAADFKESNVKKSNKTDVRAITSAAPAAGYADTPQVDRATAALNSIAETNQRVTALYEMSRTLAGIMSVEDTLAILSNRLSKLVPFTTCTISLFDASRSEFEIVHATGLHAERFIRRRQPAEAGITGYVITNQRPMYNTNPVLDLGFLGTDAASEYKGVIVFPLAKNQEPLGAISLYSTEIENYGSEHIQLMESLSQPASDAIYNAITFEKAGRAALMDPVTGLANMRALNAQFAHDRARSQRLGMPLSLMVIRVNNLDESASITPTIKDHLLASIGALIKQQLRETDMVTRHSDHAFTVLLPDSGRDEVYSVRDRVLEAIEKANLGRNIALSMGWACYPDHGILLEELIESAYMDCITGTESLTDFASSDLKNKLTVGSF